MVMSESWETLGCISATSQDHSIELELSKSYDKFRLQVDVNSDSPEVVDNGTAAWTRRIEENMEYIGNPSLIDMLLGRAEKQRKGTNAEEFIQDVLDEIIETWCYCADVYDIEIDEDAMREDFTDQIFPISSWCEIENVTIEEDPIPPSLRHRSF
jgi:hypothetical protein